MRTLAACLLTAAVFALAPRPVRAEPTVATLEEVEGDVTVVVAADGSEVDAEDDQALAPGDRIQTGPGASAVVSFADSHLVHLGSSSTLAITEVRNGPSGFWARLTLATGRLFASCDKLAGPQSGFRVETNSTVAAVKGTTFGVEADAAGNGTVSVLEGTVQTSAVDAQGRVGQPVAVAAGQETTVDAGTRRAGAPRPFAADPGRAVVRERLASIRQRAQEHRQMRQSGELAALRRFRRQARDGQLDTTRPEVRRFLRAHPAFAAHFERAAARHRQLQQRRQGRRERVQERREERREKPARRRRE